MQKNSTSKKIKTFNIGLILMLMMNHLMQKKLLITLAQIITQQSAKDEAIKLSHHFPAHSQFSFADSSQIPTMLVSKIAKEQVSVVLSGDGGDELFGGYNRYLFSSGYWKMLEEYPLPLRRKYFLYFLSIQLNILHIFKISFPFNFITVIILKESKNFY